MREKRFILLILFFISIGVVVGCIFYMSKSYGERLRNKIDNTPLEFTKKALLNLDNTEIHSIKIIWSGKNKTTEKYISSKKRLSLYSLAIAKSYKYEKADKSHHAGIMMPAILKISIKGAEHDIFLGYGYDGWFYCNAQPFGNNSFESKDLYNLIKEDLKDLNIKIDI